MRRTPLHLAAVGIAALLSVAACGNDDTGANTASSGAGPLDVVANFYPVAQLATHVGGDRVRVTNLTATGVEPHDIELTPAQVDELEDADVVLYLGEGFQPAVEDIAERRGAAAVDLTRTIKLQTGAIEAIEAEEGDSPEANSAHSGSADEGEHGDTVDPHFWLNPQLMATAVDEVAAALTAVSPGDAAKFQANARQYKDELGVLDGEFEGGLAACDRKEIVTSHAAFFYLADRYGLTQLSIAGLSPEAEPEAERLAALTDQIKAKGITTVFYEELVSPKVAETLAREAGVKTAVLSPLEGLSQDEIDAGKDYIAVMRDNLTALREALGCR